MRNPLRQIGITFALLTVALYSSSAADDRLIAKAKSTFGTIESPAESRLTEADVALGRELFWDERISNGGKISCASCHLAEDWGADHRKFSVDAKGKATARNSQSVFNAVLQPSLRWTGDRKSAAHQAEKSLTGSMGFATTDDAVTALKENGYESKFRSAFPDVDAPMTAANYAKAIQSYESILITPAPFDRFLAGAADALTDEQTAGLKIFMDVGCADCHKGALLGGDSLEKFGVVKEYWTATKSEKRDAGLYETTKRDEDRYRFRVPQLRNIAKTGPYFHDGSVSDLKSAVQVMSAVQLGNDISDADASAIATFLDALTGEIPKHYARPERR
jgi:cytochrome c peroxidase